MIYSSRLQERTKKRPFFCIYLSYQRLAGLLTLVAKTRRLESVDFPDPLKIDSRRPKDVFPNGVAVLRISVLCGPTGHSVYDFIFLH